MGAKLTGGSKVQSNLRALESRMRAAQKAAVREGGRVVVRKAKRSLDSPGYPPVTRTGNLKRSTKILGVEDKGYDVVCYIGSTAVYAPRLEFGFTGVDSLGRAYNQPPYPFLRPAMGLSQKEIQAAVQARLKVAMR